MPKLLETPDRPIHERRKRKLFHQVRNDVLVTGTRVEPTARDAEDLAVGRLRLFIA